VNSIPRPIPLGAWYCSPYFVVPAAGVLPFGSILYFIFKKFWSDKFYYVYGFMLLVYTIPVDGHHLHDDRGGVPHPERGKLQLAAV
jgi:hypothetical protein